MRTRLWIRQHPLGLLTREGGLIMTEYERGTDRLGRRAKRFLTPLQKYEIWLQLVRGETTIGEVADRFEVDRSTRVPQLRWRIVRGILGVTCGNVGLHAHTACI